MARLSATRTLTVALLGALLAAGSIAPAFAQQRDDDQDKQDRRAARKEQREQRQERQQPRQQEPRQ